MRSAEPITPIKTHRATEPRVLFRVLPLMLKPAGWRQQTVARKKIGNQILHHVEARD